MKNLFEKGSKLAEFIAAMMLAAIFVVFVIQIFSRYVLNSPFNWTLELCLTLWVWVIFFGNAFVVRAKDHVTFDILYLAAPTPVRKAMAILSAVIVIAVLAYSFLPTWDYVDFLKIRKSALLKIPMNEVFMVFIAFLLATIARYLWSIVDVVRHGPPDEHHNLFGENPDEPIDAPEHDKK